MNNNTKIIAASALAIIAALVLVGKGHAEAGANIIGVTLSN